MTESTIQAETSQQTSGETPNQTTATPAQVPFETSDPKSVVTHAEEAKAEPATVEPTKEETGAEEAPIYTTQEIDTFREKAQQFDQLDSDPGAVQAIKEYLISKGADLETEEPTQPVTTEEMSPAVRKELNDMRVTMQQMHANMQIAQFEVSTPDFKQHKEAVGKVIMKHPTFGLQEAYDHVKLTLGQKAGSEAQRTATQTPEGRQTSPVTSTQESTLADVEAKIRDPKATKSIDDAMAIAWEQAVAQETARTE